MPRCSGMLDGATRSPSKQSGKGKAGGSHHERAPSASYYDMAHIMGGVTVEARALLYDHDWETRFHGIQFPPTHNRLFDPMSPRSSGKGPPGSRMDRARLGGISPGKIIEGPRARQTVLPGIAPPDSTVVAANCP